LVRKLFDINQLGESSLPEPAPFCRWASFRRHLLADSESETSPRAGVSPVTASRGRCQSSRAMLRSETNPMSFPSENHWRSAPSGSPHVKGQSWPHVTRTMHAGAGSVGTQGEPFRGKDHALPVR